MTELVVSRDGEDTPAMMLSGPELEVQPDSVRQARSNAGTTDERMGTRTQSKTEKDEKSLLANVLLGLKNNYQERLNCVRLECFCSLKLAIFVGFWAKASGILIAQNGKPLGNVAKLHGKNTFIFRGLKKVCVKCGKVRIPSICRLRFYKPRMQLAEKMTRRPEPARLEGL